MPRPAYPLSILEFQERFATEEACREYLFASRWPEGFVCPACGSARAGEMHRKRLLWQCKDCGQQTSATAGTVMHGTHTPLRTWFWAAYLVATHHPGISAKQLQRQLGLSRYETAWLILQKLRRAMVAPERGLLRGEVEIDEFWLGGYEEGLRGSRQRGKKALVGVAIEVRGAGSGRLRLADAGRLLRPDAARLRGRDHEPPARSSTPTGCSPTEPWPSTATTTARRPQSRAARGEQLLPRAHRAISNLKAWMHGTHRGVSDEHLPVYLDEYVFRHNRRGTPMAAFQTLLGLGALHQPTTYSQITRRAA
ncbi:MAG: IS1595 family transposase [Thermoleophilaceae bacterium]